jgi:hypothetical protein
MSRHATVTPGYLRLVLLVAAVFNFSCTAITGGRTLEVDTRNIEGAQYQPQEISRMLESLGYQWLPVHAPDIGHPVKVAERNGQYRMLFQAKAVPAIRVEVHIRLNGNTLGLHVYETGNKELSEPATRYYHELRQRLVLEYGMDNVTDKHPLLAP